MRSLRRQAAPIEVALGERVLAWCRADDGRVIAGTRDALYLGSATGDVTLRLPWEGIEAADWDGDARVFRVAEVGSWGEERREHACAVTEPGRMLELVRERVTASVVLQRHVPVRGRRGLRVVARRAPRGDRPIEWFYEYDEGVDPEDHAVASAARRALAAALDEVGP